jgi:hypothetical protein
LTDISKGVQPSSRWKQIYHPNPDCLPPGFCVPIWHPTRSSLQWLKTSNIMPII